MAERAPVPDQPVPVRPVPLPVRDPSEARRLAAELAALHARAFGRVEEGWDARGFAAVLADPGLRLWLARPPGAVAPAGLLLARVAAGEGEVLTLAVDPPARRRGLARGLLAALLTAAEAAGLEAVHLEVAAGNAAARALYRGAGFRETGLRRGYYRLPGGVREDAVLMTFTPGTAGRPDALAAGAGRG